MDNKFDVVIIGAGIVGAATAFKLSNNKGLRIAVIDKEEEPGIHQTGRNSGVIHSGVYYPKGSLKSQNCINGYKQLISFLKENELPHKITGKLIAAANNDELVELERLFKNAKEVGLNVRYVSEKEIKSIDTSLSVERAFLVEETGITDYKEVLKKFIELSEARGVEYFFSSQIKKVSSIDGKSVLDIGAIEIIASTLVNCAGLQSDRVYEICTGKRCPVRIIPFKGEYFHIPRDDYSSDIPIYPVPNPEFPFLGIHLTRMIDGSLNVGPNAILAFDREGYNRFNFNLKDFIKIVSDATMFNILKKYGKTVVKELLKAGNKIYFEKNVRKYFKNFSKTRINGYSSGIRAQATENGSLLSDFRIETFQNQVHILNAPSPAATSCLAIADEIIKLLKT